MNVAMLTPGFGITGDLLDVMFMLLATTLGSIAATRAVVTSPWPTRARRMVDGPSDDPEVNGRNVAGRVTWDINISTVIILLTALGGGMYFVAQARSQTEQAQRDIARLELTIQTGLTALTQQLAGLPFQQAALKNLEERVQESIRWRTQEEDRVNRLRDTVSQAVADLELLKRASSTGVLSAPARSH